jgi:hypothetical protein
MTQHVLLLGDSIFDNRSYIHPDEPDVMRQVAILMPRGGSVLLGARDGDVTKDVKNQLQRATKDTTHLVVSAGGNDALGQQGILSEPADSVAEALIALGEMGVTFENDYREMVGILLATELPTVLCTIYYPRFQDQMYQKLACTALTIFNDVILRVAFESGLPVCDLRLIFNGQHDYANDIEPSAIGGWKMARAITQAVTTHNFGKRRSELFARAA